MIKIVVDAMGGDNGSSIVVEAVKNFLRDNKDVEITLVGKKEELESVSDICRIRKVQTVSGIQKNGAAQGKFSVGIFIQVFVIIFPLEYRVVDVRVKNRQPSHLFFGDPSLRQEDFIQSRPEIQ